MRNKKFKPKKDTFRNELLRYTKKMLEKGLNSASYSKVNLQGIRLDTLEITVTAESIIIQHAKEPRKKGMAYVKRTELPLTDEIRVLWVVNQLREKKPETQKKPSIWL